MVQWSDNGFDPDVFSRWDDFFAKERGYSTEYLTPELMKFLVSQMAGLKLQLLDRIVLPQESISAIDSRSIQRTASDPMAVCRAVEDRICQHIDLTTRLDLDDRQMMAALRLLLKIVQRNRLAVDFSPSEVFLLRHGSRTEMPRLSQTRPSPI
jgi:hypothetical protein